MLERMGQITRQAYLNNVPVLGMVYVRGENVKLMEVTQPMVMPMLLESPLN